MSTRFSSHRRVGALLAVLIVGLTAMAGVAVATAAPASALCATPPMTGNWRNIDPNTRSVTRIVVGFNCGDQILCDTNGHCTGGESYYTTHPFGKCHPTDCDWGVRRAYAMADGWERSSYTYSWATTYVWIKTYSYSGLTYLRVYTWTDFTAADGRTDYSTDEWFRK